jgi:hypothetical protein
MWDAYQLQDEELTAYIQQLPLDVRINDKKGQAFMVRTKQHSVILHDLKPTGQHVMPMCYRACYMSEGQGYWYFCSNQEGFEMKSRPDNKHTMRITGGDERHENLFWVHFTLQHKCDYDDN